MFYNSFLIISSSFPFFPFFSSFFAGYLVPFFVLSSIISSSPANILKASCINLSNLIYGSSPSINYNSPTVG